MRTLNEVEFQYTTPMVSQISAYAGHGYFIHFGRTPKLGVKLKTFHNDPKGVYFYSLDWLLSQDRFRKGRQYATDFPYWTIVQLISSNGIVFSKFSFDDLDRLAEQNNFIDWDTFKTENTDKPAGSLLLKYIHRMGGKGINPNSLVKGLDFIHDDGLGIFHTAEADQIVIMNPKAIRVIASGQYITDARTAKNRLGPDKYTVVSVLKKIQEQFGGEITWKHKKPTLTINRYATHVITYDDNRLSEKIRITSHWGRAVKDDSILIDAISVRNMNEVVEFFASFIEPVEVLAKAGRDLLFTPSISENDVRDLLVSMIDKGFITSTEIDNKHKTMTVSVEKSITVDGINLLAIVSAIINEDINDNRWIARVAVNSRSVSQARAFEFEEIIQKLVESVSVINVNIRPSDRYNSLKHFYYENDYDNFIGWMVYHSGIIGLREAFDYNMSNYLRLSDLQKQNLIEEIKRIF